MAARTRAAFFQATERHGLTQSDKPQAGIANGASVEWREETGSGTALIAAQARFFDLIVLGRSDRVIDQPASDVIEGTLVQSGRPVLLAPATPPVTIGETIAIGWDGSPRSVRAITAALPLLRQAKKTVIIAIDDDPDTASTAPITDYLGWHGIASDGQQLRAMAGVGRGNSCYPRRAIPGPTCWRWAPSGKVVGVRCCSAAPRKRWSAPVCCRS